MNLAPVSVVAGIIRRNGRVLLTRRPEGVHLGGLWEFPGGKLEEGETAEAGLAREILEELRLSVRVGDLFLEVEHAYPDRIVHLRFFECSVVAAEVPSGASAEKAVRCEQPNQVAWVRPADLEGFSMPEANRQVIRKLRGEWNDSNPALR